MRKAMNKFIAKLLIAVLLLSVFGIYSPVTENTANAAELPVVNEAQVTERVKELARLLEINSGTLDEGSGVLFTANGKACGHATGNAGDCTNCFNANVINTSGNWFNKKFGYTINPELLPGHYNAPSGSLTNKAWTCAGFANFALWYIAKADNTSDVYRDPLGTPGAKFTYSNLQEFDIRIGDVVRVPEMNHSFMFLEYVGDSTIKVLDCNYVGGDVNKIAQVKIHNISLNSSYTMAITRARNYEPGLRKVNETQVTERVKELARLLEVNSGTLDEGSGVLFTANGNACGHATGSTCSNCKNATVVNTSGNWFHKKFGYTIDPVLLPGHYTPSGSITSNAWTCAGFTNFTLWYIAKTDNTSDVYRDLLGTQGAAFTYSNLQKFDIRIGDVLRVPELNHSFMFLEYVGDSAIKVLDCNWVNKDASKIAQVKIHNISLNSSYTMAITRARNYEPGEHVQNQEKTYATLDLSATSWSGYNVGLDAEMYADKAYTIYHGAVLEILDKVTNSKGNAIYHVYSPDLGMKCYVSAKYVKITVTPTPEPSDPIDAFVTRMYRIILEREPDAGSSTWINGLKDGSMTGVRVADGFVLSEEMLSKDISNEEFVKILYRAFFGREADEGGLATWKNLLDAGCKKNYVFAGFANSTEFGNLCAEAGIVQGRAAEYLADRQTGLSEADYKVWCFVERMYMEVLNRTADELGVRSWVGALQDGSMTGVEVADGFIMSEEFLAKDMTNEEYVRIMYRAFFGRDADPEGLATWTNALATGWTKQAVFAGFANSNEFGVLCEQAGIEKGTVMEQ